MSVPNTHRSARLRELLARGPVMMPGAFNALSARLIEREGFEAMYLSGAVLANSVGGLPDVGAMTLTEARDHAAKIAAVTSVPILMDADTGFGDGPHNIARTVRELEAAGVSAIHIEDQEFPKRCGHLSGKRLIPVEEMCGKIAAAKEAKVSADFMLIARTDARGVSPDARGAGAGGKSGQAYAHRSSGTKGAAGGNGRSSAAYDEAVARAHAYLKAGADGIFPEALESREEFARFAKDVPALLLANMTEFGKTPMLTVDEFGAMGYRLIIFPVTLQRLAMKTVENALKVLKRDRSQRALVDQMQTRQELYDLLGYDPNKG